MAFAAFEVGAAVLSTVGGMKVGAALKPIAEAGVKIIAKSVPELAENPQVVEAGAKALTFCAGIAGSACVHKAVYEAKDAVEFGIALVDSFKNKLKQKESEKKEEVKTENPEPKPAVEAA